MGILREPQSWRRERPANETRHASDLTPEERANVRRAIHVLRRRHGTYRELAAMLRVRLGTLRAYGSTHWPSAGVAVRVARLAGVPIDDVLAGRWPVEGACPHCGRS